MLFTQSAVIPPLIGFLTPLDCPPCCIANHCIVLSLLLICSSMEYVYGTIFLDLTSTRQYIHIYRTQYSLCVV